MRSSGMGKKRSRQQDDEDEDYVPPIKKTNQKKGRSVKSGGSTRSGRPAKKTKLDKDTSIWDTMCCPFPDQQAGASVSSTSSTSVEWVSASAIRNYMLNDPILDW